MIPEYLKKYKLGIVVVGNFNPSIFNPAWLELKKLIRKEEVEKAKIQIIHSEISVFEIGDWLSLQVEQFRLIIRSTREEMFEPLKDLLVGILTILSETPVEAIGINHNKYYTVSNDERYYQIGNKLAPLQNWSDFLRDPRMVKVEILQSERTDSNKGRLTFSVSVPDEKMPKNSLMVAINDHFDLETHTAKLAVNTINEVFELSIKNSSDMIQSLWEKISND